jgi:spore coat polysaccharide biosynthesis protein SpsF
MNPRIVVVVQARMSSTRLPGKVLRPLAGAPAIVRLMERLVAVDGVDEALVATSVEESDDMLAAACRAHGVRCERGPLDDVLERYVGAATAAHADIVVRCTGDCPLIDPVVVAQCVRLFRQEQPHIDYASNVDERTFPVGLDTEVVSMAALQEAARTARKADEREHVTPWVRRHKRKVTWTQEADLSALRWTLDYIEDYRFIASVYDALWSAGRMFSADDVYRLLLAEPERLYVTTRQAPDEPLRTALLERLRVHLGSTLVSPA